MKAAQYHPGWSANTIDDMFVIILSAGTWFDEVINNLIQPNFKHKPALHTELAISLLSNRDKSNEAIREGWFKYLFINVAKNQIHSKTSPFHSNNRKEVFADVDVTNLMVYDDSDDDLDYKMQMEEDMQELQAATNQTKLSWFESEMKRLYWDEGKTLREIEDEYGIDHCAVYKVVTRVKNKIENNVKKNK